MGAETKHLNQAVKKYEGTQWTDLNTQGKVNKVHVQHKRTKGDNVKQDKTQEEQTFKIKQETEKHKGCKGETQTRETLTTWW